MSRAQRLLDLIQLLRSHRRAVTAAALADKLSVSLRTLYRDIESLKAQGADIVGEAGIGYVLRPGFMLPPLMFSEEEVEALVLGCRWVSERGDDQLGKAAHSVLTKIGAVLPDERRWCLDTAGLLIGPGESIAGSDADIALIRQTIRSERKMRIAYADEERRITVRIVWPVALAYYDRVRIVVAWCELRDGYRHFRIDRIASLAPTAERYPRRRAMLLKEWHAVQGVPEQ